MPLKNFDIAIIQPEGTKVYHLGDDFWRLFEYSLVNKGALVAEINIKKLPNGLKLFCSIQGVVSLICDRSMEEFEYPIQLDQQVTFKFGNEDKELDIDSYVIGPHTATLNVSQHLYDFVSLAIPMKKIHPQYTNRHD